MRIGNDLLPINANRLGNEQCKAGRASAHSSLNRGTCGRLGGEIFQNGHCLPRVDKCLFDACLGSRCSAVSCCYRTQAEIQHVRRGPQFLALVTTQTRAVDAELPSELGLGEGAAGGLNQFALRGGKCHSLRAVVARYV